MSRLRCDARGIEKEWGGMGEYNLQRGECSPASPGHCMLRRRGDERKAATADEQSTGAVASASNCCGVGLPLISSTPPIDILALAARAPPPGM